MIQVVIFDLDGTLATIFHCAQARHILEVLNLANAFDFIASPCNQQKLNQPGLLPKALIIEDLCRDADIVARIIWQAEQVGSGTSFATKQDTITDKQYEP